MDNAEVNYFLTFPAGDNAAVAHGVVFLCTKYSTKHIACHFLGVRSTIDIHRNEIYSVNVSAFQWVIKSFSWKPFLPFPKDTSKLFINWWVFLSLPRSLWGQDQDVYTSLCLAGGTCDEATRKFLVFNQPTTTSWYSVWFGPFSAELNSGELQCMVWIFTQGITVLCDFKMTGNERSGCSTWTIINNSNDYEISHMKLL